MRVAAAVLGLLVLAGTATGGRVRVALVGRPPALVTGAPWTAKLTVRPASFTGDVRVTATGPARTAARATGGRGSYRARLVFPEPGRWTLSARAGGSTSRLGTVTVRSRAEPLVFVYPTSVAVEPGGSLLVAENGAGKVDRIDPVTGTETVIASGLSRPYSLAVTTGGETLVSTDDDIVRLLPEPRQVVASAPDQIGPIASAPSGDLYFTISTTAYRVPTGGATPEPIAQGLSAPHGIAVAADGSVLVDDTGHNRVVRIDPAGRLTTFAQVDQPDGLAVAADGTVYVCDGVLGRIVHLSATGARLGFVGDFFDIPYALAVAPDGALYVAEATVQGRVKHVAPDGTVTTISARRPPAGR
jgi:streptogramin lyase